MIASGSQVPGVDWDSLRIPEGTAIRYERPDESLRPHFLSYAVLDSDPTVFTGPNSWLLPEGVKIWIVLADAPITTKIRNRLYAPLGVAVLYGPTSRAMPVTSNGGVSIVIDLSPVGWARWFDLPAEAYRDRITPLGEIWPAERVDMLVERLHHSDRGAEVKAILDDFLRANMPPPNPSEALIEQAVFHLADPALNESAEVAAALGISAQTLLRLSRRHFGFGPKLLMRRRRFLRVLTALLMEDAMPGAAAPSGFHDISHFVRDGKDFLGITPRRFLRMPQAYLRAALRARQAIIGEPWSILDRPG